MRLGFWLWNVTTFLMRIGWKAQLMLTAVAPFKWAFLFRSSSLTFIPVHRSFGHFAKTNMAACLGSSVMRWGWPPPERLSRERACQVSHQAGTNRVDITIPWGRTAAPDWQPSFCSSLVRYVEPTRLISPRLLPSRHTALKIITLACQQPCVMAWAAVICTWLSIWFIWFDYAEHTWCILCKVCSRLQIAPDLRCHYLCLIKPGAGLSFHALLENWSKCSKAFQVNHF